MAKKKKEEGFKIEIDSTAEHIRKQREYFAETSAKVRANWVEYWKMYISYLDMAKNPFLANLFIPKTHEAIELLAAFLIGPNQSIAVEAEGKDDVVKEPLAQKLLDFQWRKTMKMRPKLLTWIKQGLIFSNGVMKAGWNADDKNAFAEVISLPDVYFDYFTPDIQDSAVIHRIVKLVHDVQEDERYNEKRKMVVSTTAMSQDEEKSMFSSYDATINLENPDGTTELLEHWTKEKVTTIAPTATGYQVIREMDNEYKDEDGKAYIPFVKLRIKNNPLPNRAYDIGIVEPTVKIQKAFNDLINELFDNVSLSNNTMWKQRRGAAINPMDLVSRPGGVIEMDNIHEDLEAVVQPDIKMSGLKMLEMLDNEFQQASMVVNLLKGVPGAEFATEASLGQANVQTLLDMVDQNIKDALAELGHMILTITLQHKEESMSFRVLDREDEATFVDVNLGDIKGKYDVRITADRSSSISKDLVAKQMLDFLKIIAADQTVLMQYPDAKIAIYKKWLEERGLGHMDVFQKQPPSFDMFNQMNGGPQTGANNAPNGPTRPSNPIMGPAISKSVGVAPTPKVPTFRGIMNGGQ